jgi:hypothetical protein
MIPPTIELLPIDRAYKLLVGDTRSVQPNQNGSSENLPGPTSIGGSPFSMGDRSESQPIAQI